MCDYDIRKCFTCGKNFKPTRPNQVTCSAECQHKRNRFTSNRSGRKRYKEVKEEFVKKDKRIAELEAKIAEYDYQNKFVNEEAQKKLVEYADKLDEAQKLYKETKAQLDIALQANQELAKKIEEIEKSAKAGKKGQKGQVAPVIPNIKLEQCLRCNARAMYLPCGKNVICWQNGVPCERCKDMEMPDMDKLGGSEARTGITYIPKDRTEYMPEYE